MKIMLLAGGWSPEREISLRGAREINAALKRLGHSVTVIDPLVQFPEIISTGAEYDFIFINMHGSPGEDGLIQATLEKIPAPYNGSDAAASLLALNKYVAKIYFKKAGLPVCPDVFVTYNNRDESGLPFPCPAIMKPNTGGSSISLRRLDSPEDYRLAREELFRSGGDEYLVEPMIAGMELTCPVLGNSGSRCEAMPVILIQPERGAIFDYHAKYIDGAAREICPAPIDAALNQKIGELAVKAHEVLGLSGFSRSDFIVAADGSIYLLETNTLPGMTPNSLLPKSAKAIGMSFEDLLERVIGLGLEKFNAKHRSTHGQ